MNTTTLNAEFLTYISACKSAITFVKNNNLEQFPLSRLNEIVGDFNGYKRWMSSRRYDDNSNQLTHVDSDGFSRTKTYDANSNELTCVDSTGYSWTKTYDANSNELTFASSSGFSRTFEYKYWPTGQLKSIHENGQLLIDIPLI